MHENVLTFIYVAGSLSSMMLSQGAVKMYLARTASGQTRASFAAAHEMHASVVGDLEGGRRSPGRRLSLTLESALNVDPSWWDVGPAPADLAKYERLRKEERAARGRSKAA